MQQRQQFSIWLLQQDSDGKPGEFVYSNAGYAIIAAIEEQVAGKSWETLLNEIVFQPLKLTSAGLGWPASIDVNQPWGHWRRPPRLDKIIPHPPNDDWFVSKFNAPAGDVFLSIEDYAKYIQMHLKGMRGEDGLLKSETIKYIHSPVGEYALGWSVLRFHGWKCSLHNGSAGTFFSAMAVCHDKDLAVVVLTNIGGNEGKKACLYLIDKVFNSY